MVILVFCKKECSELFQGQHDKQRTFFSRTALWVNREKINIGMFSNGLFTRDRFQMNASVFVSV